jgi:hypothetical protein
MNAKNNQELNLEEHKGDKLSTPELQPSINDIVRKLGSAGEILKVNPGVAREYKNQVGEIIEPSETAMERTKDMLDRASAIESFSNGEETGETAERQLAGFAGERGWQSVFTELKSGDKVAYFATPGGEFSIKSLNSKLGEQATDNLIKARKDILKKFAKENGISALVQDFKGGFFKLPENLLPEESARLLNQIAEQMNGAMAELIIDAISQRDASGEEGEMNRLRGLLSETDGETGRLKIGYRMSWGSGEVGATGQSGNFSNIVDALSQAGAAAQLGRKLSGEQYGSGFENESTINEIGKIEALGEEMIGKSVRDEDGIEYKIFTQDSQGFRVINKDLLRLLRKGEFHPDKNSTTLSGKAEQYVRRINLIDLIKPFVAEEASDGTIAGQTKRMNKFLSRDENGACLKDGLSMADKREFGELLKHDQKDSRFLAPEFFHREAMKLDECAYVNIDVLDLGVDQLLGYERVLQEAHRDPKDLSRIMREAGDSITEQMRDVRGRALKVYQRHFGDALTIARVGGDEVSFAIENPADPQVMEKFLMDLQAETGTRVIKTVVGEAERISRVGWSPADATEQDTDERLREHLSALRRAEQGTEVCKAIEKKLRTARNILENRFGGDVEKIEQELDLLEVKQFAKLAVRETAAGGFEIIYHPRGKELMKIDGDDVLAFIESKLEVLKRNYLE